MASGFPSFFINSRPGSTSRFLFGIPIGDRSRSHFETENSTKAAIGSLNHRPKSGISRVSFAFSPFFSAIGSTRHWQTPSGESLPIRPYPSSCKRRTATAKRLFRSLQATPAKKSRFLWVIRSVWAVGDNECCHAASSAGSNDSKAIASIPENWHPIPKHRPVPSPTWSISMLGPKPLSFMILPARRVANRPIERPIHPSQGSDL